MEAESGFGGGFLQKFRLYETRSKFYMIGRDKSRTHYRVLTIDRLEPSELSIREDPTMYSEVECYDLLMRIHDGNRATGGLKFVTKCYGIVGFVKFLGPYYMLLITKRRKIGTICGHVVYTVSKSEIITIPSPTIRSNMAYSKDENRYKRLLCTVDLAKDFFFSYSYNIMRSLQKNICEKKTGPALYETMFLKRGVNEKGRVANDVETEQIVFEDTDEEIPPQIASVVQNRGSIPLFWSQETSRLNIRPDIILQKKDPNYEATRLHFDNLAKRYGNPIIILNLIKTREKKPRESLLCAEFASAIHLINKDLSSDARLRFLHWDLNKHSRREQETVNKSCDACNKTDDVVVPTDGCGEDKEENVETHKGCDSENSDENFDELDDTEEIEVTSDGNCLVKPLMFQKGVLRTNCIDCLDRTNVAQYAYGLAALGRQLHALGLIDVPKIGLDSPLADELMHFYERMGDTLALQYGGSAAHNKIFSERRGQWKAATQSQEFIRTLQRYYSNAYMDAEKQDAINVFLGHFQPQQGRPALWELDSDQHYNIGRRGTLTDESARSFIKRSLSDGNILCESNTPAPACNLGQRETLNSAVPSRLPQAEDITGSDESSCSNFLDLDWLSSSGNSCEEEINERSSLINSPVLTRSTENVINVVGAGTAGTLTGEGSSMKVVFSFPLPHFLRFLTY
ncbi:Phosphoinositide phosphatase SAC2 [Ananas comosus]|uniref:Phosphoinositide phosphatase SAC2 n=1 Tax=Ananas comosus TaxID=4615 RepID=A0A199UPF3_ANACO|nr:Phosphoinositide phosphatase SAC2 [Ananas comosus]